MSNSYERLINHFGGQHATAKALKCTQPSVWAWVSGKTNMSATLALRAEKLTNGQIKAAELCPALAELNELNSANDIDAQSTQTA